MKSRYSTYCSTIAALFLLPFVAGAQPDTSMTRKMINMVDSDTMLFHLRKQQDAGGFGSRVSFTPGSDSAMRYIYSSLKKNLNIQFVELDTFFIAAPAPYNTKPCFNVIARLKGGNDSTGIVILGAHQDNSCSRMDVTVWPSQWNTMKVPGADDNASGIAGVLEIARILADTSYYFKSNYGIYFIAFGCEEGIPGASGLAGSRHLAEAMKAAGKKIVGLINMDMIAYNPISVYCDVISNSASLWIGEKFLSVNKQYTLGIKTNLPPFVFGGYSDHQSFWNAGFPAITLIEHAWPWDSNQYYTASPTYHKTSDTIGTLNIPMMKKITQAALAAIVSIASPAAAAVPQSNFVPSFFTIEQNYPNPFNPATTISFSLQKDSHVSLKVYDLVGREIATLINEGRTAGNHHVPFEANGITSGTYFYIFTVEGQSVTRTMTVVK